MVRSGTVHEDDVQRAWSVDAFDPAQLDVAGRAGTADPRQRPAGAHRLGQPGNGLRHVTDHLIGPHETDVQVGNQAERPPPLPRPVIEHDRPGLGDADGGVLYLTDNRGNDETGYLTGLLSEAMDKSVRKVWT
jgi:hypothetical protein